jgi:uncharacterized protein (TIGR03000 family)
MTRRLLSLLLTVATMALSATPVPARDPAQATVVVTLPADAKLFFDNQLMPLTGATRSFSTPQLKAGVNYQYQVSAKVVRDGQTLSQTKQITVRAGKTTKVDFRTLGGTAATVLAARANRLQPVAKALSNAGEAFDVTVWALDPDNNVAINYRGTVTFSSDDRAGTVPAPYTFTAGDAGVHTFRAGVTLKTAGKHGLTVTDASGNLGGSVNIVVSPANHVPVAYYIAANGKNTNAGTSAAAPWRDDTNLRSRTFYPGDSINFRAGDTFTLRRSLAPVGQGTASKPIAITSYGRGHATLKFNGNISGIVVANAGGYVISDLTIVGDKIDRAGVNDKSGIYFRHDGGGMDYNFLQVRNCTIQNFSNGAGIAVMPDYDQYDTGRYLNVTIDKCDISRCWVGVDASNFTHYLLYHQAYAGFSLTNCTIHDNPGKQEAGDSPSGHGILLVGASNVLIDSNTFQHNGTQGSSPDRGGCYAIDR